MQAGKFDAPDRLFTSIADAWASVTTNPADVKELIPEFYLPNPAFLVNKHNLALGTPTMPRPRLVHALTARSLNCTVCVLHCDSNSCMHTSTHHTDTGQRQNGRMVGDVELPPWAQGSPARFLATMRAALEAPVVSANLHHWLDLVFGAKQQGEAAAAADNVFHPLTYHGAVDIDKARAWAACAVGLRVVS